MDWIRQNAEVLSLGLAILVAVCGVIAWTARRRSAEGNVSQRSGDRSINVISRRDANITMKVDADD